MTFLREPGESQMGDVFLESSFKKAKSSPSVKSEMAFRIPGLLPISSHRKPEEHVKSSSEDPSDSSDGTGLSPRQPIR